MADIATDGMTRVTWATTISNTAAPTTSELNAGVALEGFITADGLGLEFGTDSIDTTALNSTFGSALPGRRTLSGNLTLKNQGDTVAPFSTFAGKPDGYLVIRRHVASTTAWTASQVVTVMAVNVGNRVRVPPAANENARFTVDVFATAAPVQGTVA